MSDSDAALDAIRSGSQRDRLEASRTLARTAIPEQLPDLRRALRSEQVPWIRSALEAAIARATSKAEPSGPADTPTPLANDEAFAQEVYARATEELTDRFVHELRPLVGRARVYAAAEIADYADSRTAVVLAQMQEVLRAVDTLGRAAAAPRTTEFDLAELVVRVVNESGAELRAHGADPPDVQMDGPRPAPVSTDPDLLALALRNGVRNAMEASMHTACPVVVSWATSASALWVAVLDEGDGLTLSALEALTPGASTKGEEHLGMGLAITRQAIASLGGQVALETTPGDMTRFEISCPVGPSA